MKTHDPEAQSHHATTYFTWLGTYALMFMLLDVWLMALAFHAQKHRDRRAQALAFGVHIAASFVVRNWFAGITKGVGGGGTRTN